MLKYKKILCPTDFSDPSYEALKTANEMARQFSAELCVLHVVAPIPLVQPTIAPTGFNVPLYQEELRKTAEKRLQETARKKVSKQIKVSLFVANGEAANEIVRIAKEEHVDLIVISTHGLTGWRHLIFGSVAEKVVRLAPCAVLTVRASQQEE
jgi:universal stress protein A